MLLLDGGQMVSEPGLDTVNYEVRNMSWFCYVVIIDQTCTERIKEQAV